MDSKTFEIIHHLLIAAVEGHIKPEAAEAISQEVCGGPKAPAALVDQKIGNEWWRTLRSRRQTPMRVYSDN